MAARDSFPGWTPEQRRARLHLVVNNARFLILPWVHVPNLASRALGLAARQVDRDWPELYGYRPVLLETFGERPRFTGTCSRAANWSEVTEEAAQGIPSATKVVMGGEILLATGRHYDILIRAAWNRRLDQTQEHMLKKHPYWAGLLGQCPVRGSVRNGRPSSPCGPQR